MTVGFVVDLAPDDLWGILLGLWLVILLALVWLWVRAGRRGRRCPRCLRPWDARAQRGWADLERDARIERRQRHP